VHIYATLYRSYKYNLDRRLMYGCRYDALVIRFVKIQNLTYMMDITINTALLSTRKLCYFYINIFYDIT